MPGERQAAMLAVVAAGFALLIVPCVAQVLATVATLPLLVTSPACIFSDLLLRTFSWSGILCNVVNGCVSGCLVLIYWQLSRGELQIFQSRFARWWDKFLRPIRFFVFVGHTIAGFMYGSTWEWLMVQSFPDSELSTFATVGAAISGLVSAWLYFDGDKDFIVFPSIQQPAAFRFKNAFRRVLKSAAHTSWKVFRVFVVTLVILNYLFEVSLPSIAWVKGGSLLSITTLYRTYLAIFFGTLSMELCRELFVIAVTTIIKLPDEPDVSLIANDLNARKAPRSRFIAFSQLASALQSDMMWRKAVYNTSAWQSVTETCVDALKMTAMKLNPDASLSGLSLVNNYVSPANDPYLIGKDKPGKVGWGALPQRSPVQSNYGQPQLRKPAEELARSPIRQLTVNTTRLAVALHMEESWYKPSMAAEDALQALMGQENGSFIVHSLSPDTLLITVVHDSKAQQERMHSATHWTGVIQKSSQGYLLTGDGVESNMVFSSVKNLVQYYAKEPYRITSAGERHKLVDMAQPPSMISSLPAKFKKWKAGCLIKAKRYRFFKYILAQPLEYYITEKLSEHQICTYAARILGSLALHRRTEDVFSVAAKDGRKFVQVLVESVIAITVFEAATKNDPEYARVFGSDLPSVISDYRCTLKTCATNVFNAYPNDARAVLETVDPKYATVFSGLSNAAN